jgi:hypothetical protein
MSKIYTGQRSLFVSKLGTPNPLPVFQWQQPSVLKEAPLSEKLSAEEVENRFIWGKSSILPYQVQDNYDRSQQPGNLSAIFIENDFLKLTLYPELGGRLASIYDKRGQRELLFDNLVFQPANLAVLNAWFSGGIEWNGLIPGHTPFTCSPVFTAIVETDNGNVLRLYEFDRIREATWQVDLYLPDNEARLWVHIKIINPNPYAIKCYWWTNMTTSLENETRVFSPADYCIEHVLPDNHLEPFEFPFAHGFDGSYPVKYPYAASVFFRKPNCEKPWIASVHNDCRGLFQTSTRELQGRKLFVFGNTSGGQHWLDFLSLPGRGNYIELQAGVMPTQDQEFTLEAGQAIEWTECIAPLELDAETAHLPDYQQACQMVENIIKDTVSDETLEQKNRWLRKQADMPVSEMLQQGSAWGMLHEKIIGEQISPGLTFETIPTVESLWAELLESGTFSKRTLDQLPTSWAISDRWYSVLEESVAKHGTTWLHELLLGVVELDRENNREARRHFETSQRLHANYMAERHLAILYRKEGDIAAAKALYFDAWKLSENIIPLAVEICQFLQKARLLPDLKAFLASLPEDVKQHERIQLSLGEVALADHQFKILRDILKREFCTVREGEISLTDLWFTLHSKEAEVHKGRPLTEEEHAKVMAQNPPPCHIDFRMTNTS